MIAAKTQCPKCNGEMIQGFIVDFRGGADRVVTSWVDGPPEKAFWSKTKAPKDQCIPVGTFRCSGCGFLES